MTSQALSKCWSSFSQYYPLASTWGPVARLTKTFYWKLLIGRLFWTKKICMSNYLLRNVWLTISWERLFPESELLLSWAWDANGVIWLFEMATQAQLSNNSNPGKNLPQERVQVFFGLKNWAIIQLLYIPWNLEVRLNGYLNTYWIGLYLR